MEAPTKISFKSNARTLDLYILFITFIPACFSSPHSKFKYFETLKPHHISIREKRSVEGQNPLSVTASFWAFQKHFSMSLAPNTRVIRPDATAQLVDNTGKSTPFSIKNNNFYTGTLDGDPKLYVDASETNGVWIAHIHTSDDFYAIEPLRFYDSRANHRDMVVYRGSDMRPENHTENEPFCREYSISLLTNSVQKDSIKVASKNRNASKHTGGKRRSAHDQWRSFGPKRHCSVLAIADFLFYNTTGFQDASIVVQYLGQIYMRVDRIFRETNFEDNLRSGYGIVVQGFIVHDKFTDSSEHYNSEEILDYSLYIQLFWLYQGMHYPGLYCLVHLNSRRTEEVVGLALSTSPTSPSYGICSRDGNLALSSIMDKNRILYDMEMYTRVVAHEMGHSWGADHDPVGDILCRPNRSNGGDYLMYPSMGISRNWHTFSPCSIREITPILAARAEGCFLHHEDSQRFCGNGIVEGLEWCDPGNISHDPCCDSRCYLARGAECSPRNKQCCTQTCQIASSDMTCVPSGRLNNMCRGISRCPGMGSTICPDGELLPQGTPCDDEGGECWDGRCKSYCESVGEASNGQRRLEPCHCNSDEVSMCMTCCIELGVANISCKVMGPKLPDGSTCAKGTCNEGRCTDARKLELDMIFMTEPNAVHNKSWKSATQCSSLLLSILIWAGAYEMARAFITG